MKIAHQQALDIATRIHRRLNEFIPLDITEAMIKHVCTEEIEREEIAPTAPSQSPAEKLIEALKYNTDMIDQLRGQMAGLCSDLNSIQTYGLRIQK